MEGFFVLLALAAIAGLVLGPIAFFLVLGARRRLTEMEGQRDRALLRLRGVEMALSHVAMPQAGAETDPNPARVAVTEPVAAAHAAVPEEAEVAPAFPAIIQAVLQQQAAVPAPAFTADNLWTQAAANALDGAPPAAAPQDIAQDNDPDAPFGQAEPAPDAGTRRDAFGNGWPRRQAAPAEPSSVRRRTAAGGDRARAGQRSESDPGR